ncbi:MAG: DUF2007 domain-containing protein [bacterium]|nr:DUF2007 domain-containing protein [bacterium]
MPEKTRWKLLVATSDESEAYLVKGRLESEGIECLVEVKDRLPVETQGGRAREFLVQVAVSEFEASQQILDEDMDEEEDFQ